MEKYNIPDKNSLDSMEGIEDINEAINENANEKIDETPFIPINNFRIRLQEETHRSTEIAIGKEKMMVDALRDDHKELSEGFWTLYEKSKNIFEGYWKEEISSKGSKLHNTEVPISGYPDRIRRYIQGENSGITFNDIHGDIEVKERFYRSLSETFELYACIKFLKPDAIMALVNGASRLSAICEAIGYKTNKLSIHRKAGSKGEDSYRKELSDEVVYSGGEIVPGSKVLILEDTTDLGEERTYRDARAWLKEKGVVDSPVFIERMATFSGDRYGQSPTNSDKLIGIQKNLDEEDCFLSLTTWGPKKDSDYWKKTEGRLTKIIKENPELYSEFFELIRKLGKENESSKV